MEAEVTRNGGRAAMLEDSQFIFMRWKEAFFVPVGTESYGLTIAGFYYGEGGFRGGMSIFDHTSA